MSVSMQSVLQALKVLGISPEQLAEVAKAQAPAAPAVQRVGNRRKLYQNTITAPAPVAQRGPRTARTGVVYGKAPVVPGNPDATYKARMDALDAAIGQVPILPNGKLVNFSKAVGSCQSGKDGNGHITKHTAEFDLSKTSNGVGFTVIELPPHLRDQSIRDALKACGYGWSQPNQTWASDGHGNAIHRTHCKANGSLRLAMNQDD